MFRLVPNIDLSKVINSYKSVSSRFVKRDFPKIKHYLRKEIILMNSLRKVVKKWLERKQ
uniref:transposase n=1 Tax=Bacillus wiedmannii TaxID=1890302 RepID=UPI002B4BD7A6|nr:transposase [Bacillus wiedmannii]